MNVDDLTRRTTLRTLVLGKLRLDGTVVEANEPFRRAFGLPERPEPVATGHFHSPTFPQLRARAEIGSEPVHDGTLDVGAPGAVATTLRALIVVRGGELVLVGEIDQPAYHQLMQELVSLNDELSELQREQKRTIDRLARTERELREALAQVRTLRGLLPICARCKKIKSDTGAWERLETYVERHSEAQLSHDICQECLETDLQRMEKA